MKIGNLKSQNTLSWNLFYFNEYQDENEPIVQAGSQCDKHKTNLPIEGGEYLLFWAVHLSLCTQNNDSICPNLQYTQESLSWCSQSDWIASTFAFLTWQTCSGMSSEQSHHPELIELSTPCTWATYILLIPCS